MRTGPTSVEPAVTYEGLEIIEKLASIWRWIRPSSSAGLRSRGDEKPG
jgi:hypothetical protein